MNLFTLTLLSYFRGAKVIYIFVIDKKNFKKFYILTYRFSRIVKTDTFYCKKY